MAATKAKRMDSRAGPKDWDKVARAAYFIAIGYTDRAAAASADVGERTLWDWKRQEWWPKGVRLGAERYMGTIEAETRAAILRGLQDPQEYASMARWVAERIIPEFAPPKVKAARVEEYEDSDFVGIDREHFRAMAESRMDKVGEGTH